MDSALGWEQALDVVPVFSIKTCKALGPMGQV